MFTREIDHVQSRSLLRQRRSISWSKQEITIFKLALQKFGVGRWKKIIKRNCLPGKTPGQMYAMAQQLLGKQSLSEYLGLHLDINKVFRRNKQMKRVVRRNNIIINTKSELTFREKQMLVQKNKQIYGLTDLQVKAIKLPRISAEFLTLAQIETKNITALQKLIHLKTLQKQIERRLQK